MDEDGDEREMTAEWTVHAQLKILRPETKQLNINLEHDTRDPNNNPVQVFYNYSTVADDVLQHGGGDHVRDGPTTTFRKTFVFPSSSTGTAAVRFFKTFKRRIFKN